MLEIVLKGSLERIGEELRCAKLDACSGSKQILEPLHSGSWLNARADGASIRLWVTKTNNSFCKNLAHKPTLFGTPAIMELQVLGLAP